MTISAEQVGNKQNYLKEVRDQSLSYDGDVSPLEIAFKKAGYDIESDFRVADHFNMIFSERRDLVFLINSLSKDDLERMEMLRVSIKDVLCDLAGFKESAINKMLDPETDDWQQILDMSLKAVEIESIDEDINESQTLFKKIKIQTFLAYCFSVAMNAGKSSLPYEYTMSFDIENHVPSEEEGYYSPECVECIGGIDNWILIRDLVHDMYYPKAD